VERLELAGYRVVEAASMPAGDRRGIGKSDALDAARIARAVLGLHDDDLRTPRTLSAGEDPASGSRVALRVLVVARDQMSGERTRAINVLTALLRTVDLGIDARMSLTATQLATIAGWRECEENLGRRTCRAEAVRLARRVKTLTVDLATNRAGITALVADAAPELLALPGLGAVVAAAVQVAWSHPGRVRQERTVQKRRWAEAVERNRVDRSPTDSAPCEVSAGYDNHRIHPLRKAPGGTSRAHGAAVHRRR